MKAPIMSGPFEIYLAWADKVLIVGPDQSALDVLQAAGIAVQPSCRSGYCGECAMGYIEGDIIHKDSCLNKSDREHVFCPCVSRAQTRIAIEG